jgi:guanylate kinase
MRIEKANREIKLADKFDHIVINENLEVAQEEIFEIVKSFIEE